MSENKAKRRIAEEFIKREVAALDIERDPDRLKHMLSTDIRDSLPPQVFALIGVVADRLKQNLEG